MKKVKYLGILILMGIIVLLYINKESFGVANEKYIESAKTLTYNKDEAYELKAFPSNTGGGILSGSGNPYEKIKEKKVVRKYWQ